MKKILLIFLLITVCLVACQSSDNVGREIEDNLSKIINNKEVAFSSNPFDYIEQNQNEYENIISKGEKGLQYLIEELKSSEENGLKEWIMAKASTDILQTNNPKKNGQQGRNGLTNI